MHALPEGVGVQLQSIGMCPSYQVSVVKVVPCCRSCCKSHTTVQVSKHDVKATDRCFLVAILKWDAGCLIDKSTRNCLNMLMTHSIPVISNLMTWAM